MCGLVGMISRKDFGFAFKDKAVFEQLIFADTVRGVDSTGIFGVNKFGNLVAHKTAQAAPSALKTQTFKDFLNKMYLDYRIVIGHNRASTRGATVDENAHPFVEGDICLVHNGTLTTHKQLADKEVDSHAICHSLSEKGYQDTFENIDGAFALIWYNAEEKKLYMARNKERPLNMVVTDDAFYFASELAMLEWVLRRNGVDKFKSFFLAEDKTYIWDLDKRAEYTMQDTPAKKSRPASVHVHKLKGTGSRVRTFHTKQVKSRVSGTMQQTNCLTLAHTTTTTEQNYTVGTTVEFMSVGISESRKKNKILTGNTLDVDNTPIVCSIPDNMPDHGLTALENASYLQGTISMIYRSNGIETLHLRDPIILESDEDEPDSISSRNGIMITKEDLVAAGSCCSQCFSQLNYTAEDLAYALYLKDQKDIMCKHCVDDNIKWGILSHEQFGVMC
jgi:Glutamine amidotransferase domain